MVDELEYKLYVLKEEFKKQLYELEDRIKRIEEHDVFRVWRKETSSNLLLLNVKIETMETELNRIWDVLDKLEKV